MMQLIVVLSVMVDEGKWLNKVALASSVDNVYRIAEDHLRKNLPRPVRVIVYNSPEELCSRHFREVADALLEDWKWKKRLPKICHEWFLRIALEECKNSCRDHDSPEECRRCCEKAVKEGENPILACKIYELWDKLAAEEWKEYGNDDDDFE